MPKQIPLNRYKKAQRLWLKTNFKPTEIALLCEIPKSSLSYMIAEWDELGLKRPVDNNHRRAIDKILDEE